MVRNLTNMKQRLIDYYDHSADDYHEANYVTRGSYSPLWFRQHYIERRIEAENVPRGAKVLDVGCGPGELVLSLAKRGYDIWAVDISPAMVEKARMLLQANCRQLSDRISVGDVEDLTFEDNFFDVVVAAGVIEYQRDDEKSLLEMKRVVKPGGYIILNVTNKYAYINVLDGLYRWLKKQRQTKAGLNFVKQRVLRKTNLRVLPDRRTHSPWRFDKVLEAHHLKKIRHNFFHFSPLPTPFDSVFSVICRPIGMHMESLTNSAIARFLAGGYLVVARKEL